MVKRKSLSIRTWQDDFYDGYVDEQDDGFNDEEFGNEDHIEFMEDCKDDHVLAMKRGEIHRIR